MVSQVVTQLLILIMRICGNFLCVRGTYHDLDRLAKLNLYLSVVMICFAGSMRYKSNPGNMRWIASYHPGLMNDLQNMQLI